MRPPTDASKGQLASPASCARVQHFVKVDSRLSRSTRWRVARTGRPPSPTGYSENGLLDPGQSEVLQHIQLEMGHVRQLVGHDGGIDDRRAIDVEGLADPQPHS